MRAFAILGCVALLLVGCVTIEDAPPMSVGQIFEGQVKYGSFIVPLPEGSWTVIKEYRRRTNLNATIGELALAKISPENIVEKVVTIATVVRFGDQFYGWKPSSDCERSDMHYVKRIANDQLNRECSYVNHLTPGKAKASSFSGQVSDALQARGITVPSNAVASFFNFSNTMNLLVVSVVFNPEADGLAPSANPDWSLTEWNPRNINGFPERKAYVDKVIAWTQEWEPRFKTAFRR